jgi:hypothetical protein
MIATACSNGSKVTNGFQNSCNDHDGTRFDNFVDGFESQGRSPEQRVRN